MPKTLEGKQISARNSLKHGLTARQTVLPAENKDEFDALVASFRDHYHPHGPLEIEVTDEIAASLWRLQRARAHEASVLELQGEKLFTGDLPAARGFDRVIRYMSAIERQFNRAIVRLQQLQAERRKSDKTSKPAPKSLRDLDTEFEEFVSSMDPFVPPHSVEECEAAAENALERAERLRDEVS